MHWSSTVIRGSGRRTRRTGMSGSSAVSGGTMIGRGCHIVCSDMFNAG